MRARARNTQALAAAALLSALAWTGCFPEPDVNKMKCTEAKGCPSGYACTNTGTEWRCRASVDGSPSPDTPMVTPSDGSSMDGVVRSDGVGLDVGRHFCAIDHHHLTAHGNVAMHRTFDPQISITADTPPNESRLAYHCGSI